MKNKYNFDVTFSKGVLLVLMGLSFIVGIATGVILCTIY